jgi:glycine/D-amino acid oxidase-like deaminating enzyme
MVYGHRARLEFNAGGLVVFAERKEVLMAEPKADVLVLGAGMVGVSAALHLQRLGRDVILVDRNEHAGDETSYGNAGIIECASVFPYMFPRDVNQIIKYALNRSPQAYYRFSELPDFLPWLLRYYLASSPARAMHSAMAELPLIRRSLIEHEALIAEAGVPELLRRTGWIKLFRSEASLAAAVRDAERVKQYDVPSEILDSQAIAAREPSLTGDFAGAVYWPTPGFIADPGALAKAYAALFVRKGAASPSRMRERSRRNPADGASMAPPRARSWWRSDHGPIWCSARSDIRSRSGSSAAITCISRQAATPCSIIRFWIPISAICLRR